MIYHVDHLGVLTETSLGISVCISISLMCIIVDMMGTRKCQVDTTGSAKAFHDISRKPFGGALGSFLGVITVCFNIHKVYLMRIDVYSKLSGRYHGFGGRIS